MHLILYGPEGSGKGTQAKLLSRRLNVPIYTSGDLVRDAAKNDKGKIGEICRRSLREGVYVPDNEMFILWENKLKSDEAKKGFILDGFPRNINQARFLMENSEKYGYDIDKFIYLELSDEESIKRLSQRHRKLFEGSEINHDNPSRVMKRLKVYKEGEKKILKFFRSKHLILKVNAERTIEEVFESIIKSLGIK